MYSQAYHQTSPTCLYKSQDARKIVNKRVTIMTTSVYIYTNMKRDTYCTIQKEIVTNYVETKKEMLN
jgi:hypothetical protein